jgi:anti-anti-sigma factor
MRTHQLDTRAGGWLLPVRDRYADACQGDNVLTDRRPVSGGPQTIADPDDVGFAVCSASAAGRRTVHVSGELDIATRDLVCRACLEGIDLNVVVDMTHLTFIDCCGYGALMRARRILTDLGGSLTIRNQVRQPASMLSLLALLEAG